MQRWMTDPYEAMTLEEFLTYGYPPAWRTNELIELDRERQHAKYIKEVDAYDRILV